MEAVMAVCAVFLLSVGLAFALLLSSSHPIPRHVFIFEMIAKLSESQNDTEHPFG
jgi:hypothetical protein